MTGRASRIERVRWSDGPEADELLEQVTLGSVWSDSLGKSFWVREFSPQQVWISGVAGGPSRNHGIRFFVSAYTPVEAPA